MSSPPFVHLHCHSHYSLLDGASQIPQLVRHVKALGMPAVALTDHGNLYGAMEFLREAKAAGILPIVGMEAYVAPGRRNERTAGGVKGQEYAFHLTLLARNAAGFKNLMRLSSLAFLEGFYYKPRIDKEILERHSEGLICLSGCASAEFSDFILNGKMAEAERLCAWYQKVFGEENFYVEIQDNGVPIQHECAKGAIDIARRMGLPLVGTSDAHYLTRDDADAHDVLLCISTGKTLDDPTRMKFDTREFYVRSPEEMYAAMPEHEEALATSARIAAMVEPNYESLGLGRRHFPSFSPPDGKTPEDYLRQLCEEGLRDRYGDDPGPEVRQRLEHELGIINRMGFASYFLIVWDFVRYARERGIPALARGSACGALVSYLLKLSSVCPLKYDLLFERFLDPNRSEAPDIDIDLCQDRRYEVIEYVRKKYGDANVAQIGTFGTLKAKAAIKDVGRVMNIPLARVEQINKMVPQRLNITIEDAIKEEPALKRLSEDDPEVGKLLDFARRLEGMNRNPGTHAAGVVIADRPLEDLVPLQKLPNKDKAREVVTTQWEMGDIEKAGLLKMDFLGLRNLTTLALAVKIINGRHPDAPIDLERLPLDDPKTFEIFQKGETKGVFQFESAGIRDLLIKMRPDRFTDIIATNALYRPGPLNGGMVDEFVDIKNGRKQAVYLHPVLKEILEETYGIMCIHEDARVSMADGSEKPIQAVRRGDIVHSLNRETGRFEFKECHGCGPTRFCDGVRITLENGLRVTLTDDHEVLTFEGMKPAGQLDPECDLVAAPRSLPQAVAESESIAPWLGCDEDVAYLLGYLVGDGCLTGTGISLATGVEGAHGRLMAWLANHLPGLRLNPYFHMRSWYLGLSHPELAGLPAPMNRRTRLHQFLEASGLKAKAPSKRIPPFIFRSRAEVRAAFLAGLIDADGCLAPGRKGLTIASVCSTSPGLLQDVRRLCQLAGISFRVSETRIHFWDTRTLRRIIEPYLIVKQFVGRQTPGTAAGWLPRREVFAAVPAGESLRSFCGRTGIQRRGLAHPYPWVKSSTAAKAGIELGDVRYYRIVSIDRVTNQQFYGMSVADHHNLVADGVVVKNCYQEQVMRILNRLGGIELSRAYATIKAISKKKADVIAQSRDQFIAGAVARKLERDKATKIFDLIEYFGGYGFNKSHSCAYALVAYQTAYLKAHYPTEYMAAVLSNEMDGQERDKFFLEHIEDCRRLGIEVLPPDINAGHLTFQVAGEGRIHFGLGAIKGVGFKAVEAIIKAREEGGPFHSLDDFFERVPTKEVGAGCVETLIHAGAFDGLGARRAQLLAVLPRALQAGQAKQEDKKRGQLGLFDLFEHHGPGANGNGNGHANGNGKAHPPVMNLPDVPELSDAEKLAFEKKALGFYMSSHPLARYAGELQALATHRVADLPGVPEKVEVVLGGMISGIQIKSVQKSRSGLTRMAKLTFEDLSGSTPAMLWPEEFAKMEALVKSDQVVFVRGALDRRRDPPELIISRIIPLEQGRAELTRGVVVRLHKGVHQAEHLERLLRAIRIRPGNLDVYLEVMGLEQVRRVIYRAAPSLRVRYDERLCTDLENAVGAGLVRLLGHRGATTRIDSGSPAPDTPAPRTPAPALMAAPAELESDDDSRDDLDD